MQASAFSCERLSRVFIACALVLLSGCATVRPEDKEHLAEPAMTWGDEGIGEAQERHVLDNREGSTGGGSTSGGGCGCN